MRADTISAWKKLGHKTVAVLPVHYPRELFTAMDVHTVELWGPPGPPRGPDAGRIQPYAWPEAQAYNRLHAFMELFERADDP